MLRDRKERNRNRRPKLATIKPFRFKERLTGNTIKVSVSPFYSLLSVNDRTYYFMPKTGEFDGTSIPA
jgi:hypothetical protein